MLYNSLAFNAMKSGLDGLAIERQAPDLQAS